MSDLAPILIYQFLIPRVFALTLEIEKRENTLEMKLLQNQTLSFVPMYDCSHIDLLVYKVARCCFNVAFLSKKCCNVDINIDFVFIWFYKCCFPVKSKLFRSC